MHVISQKAVRDFASTYPEADAPLPAWHKTAKTGTYRNLVELRRTFASVDYVPVGKKEFYVFNIGGNKYRLVASIHFNRQRLFVRFIMTHREYDRGDWKK